MRHHGLVSVITAVLIATLAGVSPAATRTISLSYDEADLVLDRSRGYDVVMLPGLDPTQEVGRPELPVHYVRFALPDGMTATSARAVIGSTVELPGRYLVRPVQPQVPFSKPEIPEWVEPEPSVYASPAPYPGERCRLIDVGNVSGHRVATVAFFPLSYTGASGQLSLAEEARIELTLTPAGRLAAQPAIRSARAERAVIERVRAMVANPEDVASDAGLRSRDGAIDYLVITSSSYEDEFQPLIDWKTDKGLGAAIVTTETIYGAYTGVDNAEKIRNCIIDYYTNHGTTWVLLAGDTDVVPARVAFATDVGSANENALRCDLYFSDLDGTWNADGDDTWGEITQDELDLYADVFVGRAPVNTSTEASRFVTKVLTYEGAPSGNPLPTDYQDQMLFLAEVLWSDPFTDGGICKNMIDDDSVPGQFDPITKLYQTNGQLTKSRTIQELNEGKNVTNHNGHAYYNVMSIGGSSLYNGDMDGLTNYDRQGIWYTIGCWPAAIDYNCIAEHWMNSQGGGVAFIGNSRYGWGAPGAPGNGTSDRFDREFFRQLYNVGHDVIGVAHAAHKDEFASEARTSGYTRYVLYELNLLGDPEMRIWSSNPTAATVNHPPAIPDAGASFLITVASDDGPVAGASVYLHNAETSVVAETDEGGVASVTVDPTTLSDMTLTVTGQGILPYSVSVPVSPQAPDGVPPDAVETLVAADPFDLGGVVELDWGGYTAPSDFACYKLYRDTAPFDDVAAMVPLSSGLLHSDDTAWTDEALQNAVPYWYAVTAMDVWGNEETVVDCIGPIAASVNARVLLWDADDGDQPFDGVNDMFSVGDGTELPWVESLDTIGEMYLYSTELPDDLAPFDLIIYLGGVINFGGLNVQMTDEEATALTSFVDDGGCLYVEEPNFGGQCAESSLAKQELWARFHCDYEMGLSKSIGNVQSVVGESGTLSEGMAFDYDYQSDCDQFVSKVAPNGDPGGALLWSDQSMEPRGSLYVDPVTGSRRYMSPLILGGMTGGGHPSTHLELVTRLMDELELIGTTGVDDAPGMLVNRIEQNVPNPFNPLTTISYAIARDGALARLTIHDVAGRVVTVLAEGTHDAGEHAVVWNGRDSRGRRVASGVYFARVEVDGWSDARKMVLLK